MPAKSRSQIIAKGKKSRRMLFLAAVFLSQATTIDNVTAAKTYDEAHEACLRAVDYMNCLEVQLSIGSSNPKQPSVQSDKSPYMSEGEGCITNKDGIEYCMAKKGKDIFGLPKPVGWMYRINSNGSIDYDMTPPRKVNVRGSTNRYIEIKNIHRYYSEGDAGTPSRQITLGSASTNCTGNIFSQTYSYSVNCTTQPANTLNLPGRKAEFPGVKQKVTSFIVDCKEKTFAIYYETSDGRIKQAYGWKDVEPRHVLINQRMSEHCSSVESLPLSTFYKYSQ